MNSLIGHDQVLAEMTLRQDNNRWPQAMLFHGTEGIGKEKLIYHLARKILCENKTACHECISCQQVLSGQHPDLFLLKAPEKKKVDSHRPCQADGKMVKHAIHREAG
jgi:DNA polymerase-3 subunit delta'